MNRATRVALAARELISEFEYDYGVPVYAMYAAYVSASLHRQTLARLLDALGPVQYVEER